MKIQNNIQVMNCQRNFGATSKSKKSLSNPILKESLKTAGIWLGFGLGFDYFCRKCVVFKKSPLKNSLFINAALAIIAGGFTLIKGLYNKNT